MSCSVSDYMKLVIAPAATGVAWLGGAVYNVPQAGAGNLPATLITIGCFTGATLCLGFGSFFAHVLGRPESADQEGDKK